MDVIGSVLGCDWYANCTRKKPGTYDVSNHPDWAVCTFNRKMSDAIQEAVELGQQYATHYVYTVRWRASDGMKVIGNYGMLLPSGHDLHLIEAPDSAGLAAQLHASLVRAFRTMLQHAVGESIAKEGV